MAKTFGVDAAYGVDATFGVDDPDYVAVLKRGRSAPFVNFVQGGGYLMCMFIRYLFPGKGGGSGRRGWEQGASEQSEPSEPNGKPVWIAIHIRHVKICT